MIQARASWTRGGRGWISSGVVSQASALVEQHVRGVCDEVGVVDRFHTSVVETVPLRVVGISAERCVMPTLKILPVMIAYGVEIVHILVVLRDVVLPGPWLLPRRPAQTAQSSDVVVRRLNPIVGEMRRHIEAVQREVHQHGQLGRRPLLGLLTKSLQVYD